MLFSLTLMASLVSMGRAWKRMAAAKAASMRAWATPWLLM